MSPFFTYTFSFFDNYSPRWQVHVAVTSATTCFRTALFDYLNNNGHIPIGCDRVHLRDFDGKDIRTFKFSRSKSEESYDVQQTDVYNSAYHGRSGNYKVTFLDAPGVISNQSYTVTTEEKVVGSAREAVEDYVERVTEQGGCPSTGRVAVRLLDTSPEGSHGLSIFTIVKNAPETVVTVDEVENFESA